jgi:plastocyanin
MSNDSFTMVAHAPSAIVAFALGTSVAGFLVWSGHAQSANVVSQKGRQFHPAEMTINKGDTVVIVNDDGDLRHHAYIDSNKFKFDSGDQEPGSRTSINFPAVGTFDVLCAIHPKMRLVIHVK